MGPKVASTAPGKVTVPSLDDPINTDAWRCVVVYCMEKSLTDTVLLERFHDKAMKGERLEVKSIAFRDVMNVVKKYADGKLSATYNFLKNYPDVFAPAVEILKDDPYAELPADIMAPIVKTFVLMIKVNDLMRLEKKNQVILDPIVAMAKRPTVCPKAKPKPVATAAKKDAIANVPASPAKENTTLVKRGQPVGEEYCIDDAPLPSYYNHYIMLWGFYDPELLWELIKADVPVNGLVCLDSSNCSMRRVSSFHLTADSRLEVPKFNLAKDFWFEFLKMLWERQQIPRYKDVVFQVYRPLTIPVDEGELADYMYRELSFLMYDLSDTKRQQLNYLNNLKLWDVEENLENGKVEKNLEYEDELNEISLEKITVPVVLQYVLDLICGEDGVVEDVSENVGPILYPESMPDVPGKERMYCKPVDPPLSWTDILTQAHDDVRMTLYDKIKLLDLEYGLKVEEGKQSETEISQDSRLVPKDRMPSPNIDDALRWKDNGGVLGSLWTKYPQRMSIVCTVEPSFISICSPRPYPHDPSERALDYYLYIQWIRGVANAKEPGSKTIPRRSTTRPFSANRSITESSRTLITEKICFTRDAFSSVNLNVVSPNTVQTFADSMLPLRPTSTSLVHPLHVTVLNIPSNKQYLSQEEDLYRDLQRFFNDSIFQHTNGYHFVEELSETKLYAKTEEACADYEIMDFSYSNMADSIYLMFHNSEGYLFRVPFHAALKTNVFLRDFFDYTLPDEEEWFREQEMIHTASITNPDAPNALYNPSSYFVDYSNEDFWLEQSLKYQRKLQEERILAAAAKAAGGKGGKEAEGAKQVVMVKSGKGAEPALSTMPITHVFEGYDISKLAVEFSGLKTVFYASDRSSVTVELQERLYGTQDLGVHVKQNGHLLCLYSYVCPTPHIQEPYTFHIKCKNESILAFSLKEAEDADETIEEFHYDMKLSLPNGLVLETVQKVSYPCYMKQSFLTHPVGYPEAIREEDRRVFLPNGTLLKFMREGDIVVLRGDATIISSKLEDFVFKVPLWKIEECWHQYGEAEEVNESACDLPGEEELFFQTYHGTSCNGEFYKVVSEVITEAKRFNVFKTSDIEDEKMYFRRTDGTNYTYFGDGMLCTTFVDGTKISSSFYEEKFEVFAEDSGIYDEGYSMESETAYLDPADAFVLIHTKITFEHEDYATLVFDSGTHQWTVHLPDDQVITIERTGEYSAQLDPETNFEVNRSSMRMWHSDEEGRVICSTDVDLSVFDEDSSTLVYCTTKDETDRTFVVESRGECMVVEDLSQKDKLSNSSSVEANVCLTTDRRHFVSRRDLTGFELIQEETVHQRASNNITYVGSLPRSGLRYFVVLYDGTDTKQGFARWRVPPITPDSNYDPLNPTVYVRSTYGIPPSWMHPFPKKRKKIEIPRVLACQLLVETKQSEILTHDESPTDEYIFSEIDAYKSTRESGESMRGYLRKIADHDQDTLKDLYVQSIREKIESRKERCPKGGIALQRYLKESKNSLRKQEFYRYCIRNHIVPNYFRHPAGRAWLGGVGKINSMEDVIEFEARMGIPNVEGKFTSTMSDIVSKKLHSNLCMDDPDVEMSTDAGEHSKSRISPMTPYINIPETNSCNDVRTLL